MDFRFSVLPPHVGYQQFKEGISKLKQVTGRDHQNIQHYLIGAIAGGVCREFVIAIRAQMDFRYLGQAPEFGESSIMRMDQSLRLFHKFKDVIVDQLGEGRVEGLRTGTFPSSSCCKVLCLTSGQWRSYAVDSRTYRARPYHRSEDSCPCQQ